MHLKLTVFLLSCILAMAGCSKSSEPTANAPNAGTTSTSPALPGSSPSVQPGAVVSPAEAVAVKPKIDACALLNSDEVQAVQGEAIKETKLSGQATGGFSISQCFYTLQTFTNSISLTVAHRGDGAGAHNPTDFWRETFHESEHEEKEKGGKGGKKLSEEEEEGAPPERVRGVGDEAYWTGSRIGGALYVLKGNSYLRISIGGAADQATKKNRSKTLAQKAVARL